MAGRIDVWDAVPIGPVELKCGFPPLPTERFEWGKQLGQGGFGSVRILKERNGSTEFACKSIKKKLVTPGVEVPPPKQLQHLENIKREVAVLRRLRGTLNVVYLEDAFEDDVHVHLVMEYCRGGELVHRIGKRHYSERTVASYMRAVLRTLAQCHAHHILHRDIKPDFGLAVFYEPEKLPRTDLGLDGTAWYMAPEVLSSKVYPASDVWAAGVMAYQLLTGRFPFDDVKNPQAPALSLVWRSILTDQPNFSNKYWEDISEPAKDFVKSLLQRPVQKRPTARDALHHPWLQGRSTQRMEGRPLKAQVVQRLQRFSQASIFKRTVLDMIANELLQKMAQEGSQHGAKGGGSVHNGGSLSGGQLFMTLLSNGSMHGGTKSRSVHGALEFYQALGNFKTAAGEALSPAASLASPADSPRKANPATASPRNTPSHLPHAAADGHSVADKVAAVGSPLQAAGLTPGDPAAGPAALAAAAAAVAGGAHPPTDGYQGPVKDAAASAAWDLQFMAAKMAREGSVHGQEIMKVMGNAHQMRQDHQKIARLALSPADAININAADGPVFPAAQTKAPVPIPSDVEMQRAASDPPPATPMGSERADTPASPRHGRRGLFDIGSRSMNEAASRPFTPGMVNWFFDWGRPKAGDKASDKEQSEVGSTANAPKFGRRSHDGDASPPTTPRFGRRGSRNGRADTSSDGTGAPADSSRGASPMKGPTVALAEGGRGGSPMKGQGLAVGIAEGGRGGSPTRAQGTTLALAEGGRGGYSPVRARPVATDGMAGLQDAGGMPLRTSPGHDSGEAGRGKEAEGGRRGQGAYLQFVKTQNPEAVVTDGTQPRAKSPEWGKGRPAAIPGSIHTISPIHTISRPAPVEPAQQAAAKDGKQAAWRGTVEGLKGLAPLVGNPAQLEEAKEVLRKLQFSRSKDVTAEQFAEGLQRLGYRLQPSEVEELMEVINPGSSGTLSRSQFVASQADWLSFQSNHKDEWLACLRNAFAELDANRDGRVGADDIVRLLRDKLPESEIEMAVGDALMEAAADAQGMDFEQFHELLRVGSQDSLASLDQYESRMQDHTMHGSDSSVHGQQGALGAVPEE